MRVSLINLSRLKTPASSFSISRAHLATQVLQIHTRSSAITTNMAETNGNTPSITLYTNHRCPWAHRAHIALHALGLKYEEVIIDLDRPRDPWYLEVNPRGLVPAIKYNGEIVTESGIVASFLADAHPGLIKTSTEEGGALERARVAFFVDAFFSKVQSHVFPAYKATSLEDKEPFTLKITEAVEKELEPLLANAAPFFGGRSSVGLAEALTGSFVLRLLSGEKNGFLPKGLNTTLEAKTPNFYKWATAVVESESVNYIWDEEAVTEGTKKLLARLAAK